MNVVDLTQRLQLLQQQNQRLRQAFNSGRNSDSNRGSTIDFETKYKKALKEIYEVIQANKQLKDELDNFRTSRVRMEGSMADVRKQEIFKAYETVLNEKNQLNDNYHEIQNQNQQYQAQVEALEAQINVLKGENLYLAQQKEALEAKSSQGATTTSKTEQFQQLQIRFKQKQHEYHRTIQNYEQHHVTLANQNKRADQRLAELQERLIQNDKNWRNRFESKEIEFKEIKTSVRHEYQDQINTLRKEINSLKLLNTELMTKLQTIEMQGHKDTEMSEYEIQVLSSIKELRIQMQPLKRQILQLQQQNTFEKQQAEREHTQLQLKLYEYESTIQHNSIMMKNQQEKLLKHNQTMRKHADNELVVKKLQEENRILGGRVIVLESKQITLDSRNGVRKFQENVLEFQTRVEMLLNQKENLANVKNISIHQLVTLKAYIAEMDQRLKNAMNQNDYAAKKYKSYKEKYLTAMKEIKSHQVLHNTLQSKIIGYDKLVQRLQSQLQKNVSISEMQVIEMHSKTTHEQVQIQSFKKKYQSLKEKLLLQEKYNRQQLQTVKLNYQTRIVDVNIKLEEMNVLRQTVMLYKDKNEELTNMLTQKDNEILELRLAVGKQLMNRNDTQPNVHTQSRQFILSLQETIRKQEAHMTRLQAEARIEEDSSRKRILALQRQIHQTQGEFNKVKLSSSTKHSSDKSSEEILTQNKRLKNKISEMQNELILLKGRTSELSSQNSYELQFRVSNIQIEKNQLNNRLQTEMTYKRRLEKQLNEANARNNELESELTQLNIQNSRKMQDLKYELEDKQSIIQNLEEEVRRLRNQQQQRSLDSSTHHRQQQEDHTICQTKINRLQNELYHLQADNDLLRKRNLQTNNNFTNNSTPVAFNYEVESLKHQKEEARLKIERLEREISGLKSSLANMEEEKYEVTRTINGLKSELSTLKLSHQDELFDKDRIIAQLKTKVQHNEGIVSNNMEVQSQLEMAYSQKDRQIASLRARLNSAQNDMQRMNDTINKYNQQITSMKHANESSHSSYTQQVELVLEQKTRTLRRYQEQLNSLGYELQAKNQELSSKSQAMSRVQRELAQYRQYELEVQRLQSSLTDRQGTISKAKFELSTYEDENDRLKREASNLKEQLQRLRLQMLNKDDDISSLRLQMSTLGSRLTNQVKTEMMEELNERQSQLSRVTFQLQSLQNNYNNIQQQLNDTESRQRKAQQQLNFMRAQLSRAEEQLNQTNERLMRKQTQLSQVNNEITGLKFMEDQLTEKNLTINKLRGEMTTLRIESSHVSEELEYKESTIMKQLNELKMIRQQLLEREDEIAHKDALLRNAMNETQRVKSLLQEKQLVEYQSANTTNRLQADLLKTRKQKEELEQELQQREQQWSNIQYQLNQAKTQINLVADQLQSKDLLTTKLSNECAFLKQQITRLNEQLVNKNHEINRATQQVFVQKMDYTNRTSEEVQTLSNEIFGLKRQLQSTRHTVEDLESQNRRLNIELQGSRLRYNQQNTTYLYTEEDMRQLQEDSNKKYRDIMQLQLQINQRDSEIQMLQEKTKRLQHLLTQVEEENHYTKEHLEQQVQQFIQNERHLRLQLEQIKMQSIQGHRQHKSEQNEDQLKFGLKLYTEETDRLKKIIDELTEEVTALRLKLTAYTNQEDRIQQNLVTMVMTFAEVQALRDRMKVKEEQINSVRRSFIQAMSSNDDVNSQYRFNSSHALNENINQHPKIQTFDVLSQNSHSLVNFKSEKAKYQQQHVKREMHEREHEHRHEHEHDDEDDHEIESDQQFPGGEYKILGEVRSLNREEIARLQQQKLLQQSQTLNFESQFQHQFTFTKPLTALQKSVQLPEPLLVQYNESSHYIEQLNELKEQQAHDITYDERQHVTFRSNLVQHVQPAEQPTSIIQTHTTTTHHQVTTTQQQRGRTVNIVYQGSQVQGQQRQQPQRVSHSQYQSPSGNTYIRVTPSRGLNSSGTTPGSYVPQAMNIQPVRNSGVNMSSQGSMQGGNQPRNVTGSFQSTNPQNLRY